MHGQISERFSPITYIAVGLIGSAIINVFLGFSAGFFWILFIGEIMDGTFQSRGWSSTVRANAELSKKHGKNVERTSCLLGTSYQVGNSVTWLVSSLVVGLLGCGSDYVPARNNSSNNAFRDKNRKEHD